MLVEMLLEEQFAVRLMLVKMLLEEQFAVRLMLVKMLLEEQLLLMWLTLVEKLVLARELMLMKIMKQIMRQIKTRPIGIPGQPCISRL
jgi:hypothetical protein